MSDYLKELNVLVPRFRSQLRPKEAAGKYGNALINDLIAIIRETRNSLGIRDSIVPQFTPKFEESFADGLLGDTFSATLTDGASIAVISVNSSPGVIFFEFERAYSDNFSVERQAALRLHIEENDSTDQRSENRMIQYEWANADWLLEPKGDQGARAVASQLLKKFLNYEIAADMEEIAR